MFAIQPQGNLPNQSLLLWGTVGKLTPWPQVSLARVAQCSHWECVVLHWQGHKGRCDQETGGVGWGVGQRWQALETREEKAVGTGKPQNGSDGEEI